MAKATRKTTKKSTKKTPAKKTTKASSATKKSAKKSAKKKPASKKATAKKAAGKQAVEQDVEVTTAQTNEDAPVVEASERRGEDRRKVQRRRQIDPTTCERDYSDVEIEFMRAMDEYKRNSGRMFPTCSEILEVVRALGYVRQDPASQPQTSDTAEASTGEAADNTSDSDNAEDNENAATGGAIVPPISNDASGFQTPESIG